MHITPQPSRKRRQGRHSHLASVYHRLAAITSLIY